MRRVEKCEKYELRKEDAGNAEIWFDGVRVMVGTEYQVGRKWLDVKQSVIKGLTTELL